MEIHGRSTVRTQLNDTFSLLPSGIAKLRPLILQTQPDRLFSISQKQYTGIIPASPKTSRYPKAEKFVRNPGEYAPLNVAISGTGFYNKP